MPLILLDSCQGPDHTTGGTEMAGEMVEVSRFYFTMWDPAFTVSTV